MKKKLAMSLAVVMLLLSACGGPTSGGGFSSPGQANTSEPGAVPAPSAGGKAIQFNPSAIIEETVLVDESDVKITATGLSYTNRAVEVNLSIENNTDKDLSFQGGTRNYHCSSINGYMVDGGYLNTNVTAGKKANETISFSADELSLMGITDIADIELCFYICDEDRDDFLETGLRQLKTSIADSYDYAIDTYRQTIGNSDLLNSLGLSAIYDSEEEVFSQGGVRIVTQTLATNSDGEPALLIELENTSDEIVRAVTSNVAINGLEFQDDTWSTDAISPGKRRVSALTLSSELDKNYQEIFGISEIGLITYTLEIKDTNYDTVGSPQILTLSVPSASAEHNASGEELYQSNGLHIVSKGLVPDPFELSDDIYLLLLVENGSFEELYFDISDDSISINGYMTDFLCFSNWVVPGNSAVLKVELDGSSLEKNGISKLEDITEIELAVEVRDNDYNTVADPVVTFAGKPALN